MLKKKGTKSGKRLEQGFPRRDSRKESQEERKILEDAAAAERELFGLRARTEGDYRIQDIGEGEEPETPSTEDVVAYLAGWFPQAIDSSGLGEMDRQKIQEIGYTQEDVWEEARQISEMARRWGLVSLPELPGQNRGEQAFHKDNAPSGSEVLSVRGLEDVRLPLEDNSKGRLPEIRSISKGCL